MVFVNSLELVRRMSFASFLPSLSQTAESSNHFNLSPVLCPALDLLEQMLSGVAEVYLGFTAQLCVQLAQEPRNGVPGK